MKRVPKVSPEEVMLSAIEWEDVIRRTRQPLDLSPTTVLTLGAVVYEDEEFIVVAQEIDPDEKHWLKSEMDQVRIPKRLIRRRVDTSIVKVRGEESDVEPEEDTETSGPTGLS